MAIDDDLDDDDDDTQQPVYEDDEPESGVFRWMSTVVVLLAVVGFFSLAWYAYRNGGDNANDNDVEIVKADKTPVKEAPVNPGGMQIPNQDKTVYGLISGKPDKQVVERVLPAPEAPMQRGEAETWMSDSLKSKSGGEAGAGTSQESVPTDGGAKSVPAPATLPVAKEQFNPGPHAASPAPTEIAEATAAHPVQPTQSAPPPTPAPSPTPAPAKPASVVLPAQTPTPQPAAKPPVKPQTDDSDESDNESDTKPSTAPATPASAAQPSGARVQLGAYRSQAEADGNWAKISREFSDDLSGKQHYVVRADLGSKGTYYRLQLGPFASSKEAEQFCIDFVSAGKACFPVKGK